MVTLLTCIIASLVGIACLLWSGYIKKEPWLTLVREVGAVSLALGVLTAAWDFAAKRTFAEEILRQLHVSEQLNAAGVTDVTTDFAGLSWNELFRGARRVDLFFASPKSWLFANHERLRAALRDRHVRIRVVIPDATSADVLNDLAHRWGSTNDDVRSAIQYTETTLKTLSAESSAVAHVEIWALRRAPLYTYYRFDNVAIFATYNHSPSQKPVPAFVCSRPGSLFSLLESYFDEMTDAVQTEGISQPHQALIARRIFSVR